MSFAYAKASEPFIGDFIVSFTMNSAEDFFPPSFGLMPASGTITDTNSGAVQARYPGRPYFSNPSSNNIAPMGDTGYQVTGADGDEFSIHRAGDVVRFYKNLSLSLI